MRRKLSTIIAAAALMALAACDTQPATNVEANSATLNAKGACTQGASGVWYYEIKSLDPQPVGGGVSAPAWERVGPEHGFSCSQNTGEVAFTPEQARYLRPGTRYAFRLVSRLDNGSVQAWDSQGTNGGTAFDSFTTQPEYDVVEYPPAEIVPTSGTDPMASDASCHNKELKNIRKKELGIRRDVAFRVLLRVRWRYCHGQIVKMWPALESSCMVTSFGAVNGYKCLNPDGRKIRAYSLGGDPEHAVYTYAWDIEARDPVKAIAFYSNTWCASTYISGSDKTDNHYRNGRCDLVPWGT